MAEKLFMLLRRSFCFSLCVRNLLLKHLKLTKGYCTYSCSTTILLQNNCRILSEESLQSLLEAC